MAHRLCPPRRRFWSEIQFSNREKGSSLVHSPMLSRRWSVSVIILVVGLACFGSLPLVEARQDAATPSPISSPLQWEPCDDVPDAECASIAVPIDPAKP